MQRSGAGDTRGQSRRRPQWRTRNCQGQRRVFGLDAHPHHRARLRFLHLPSGYDRAGCALSEGEKAEHLQHLPGERLLLPRGLRVVRVRRLLRSSGPGCPEKEETEQVRYHAGSEHQHSQRERGECRAGARGGVRELWFATSKSELLLSGLSDSGIGQNGSHVPEGLQPVAQQRHRAQPVRSHSDRLYGPTAAGHHIQRQPALQ